MNNKITFPELAALLTEKTRLNRKQSETFLREMFRAISDTLASGEGVKIKGLGTFKLSAIEARKSVNVNTGEEFEIPGHTRVSFVPAKELAETVNAPFDAFETVELSDGVTDEDLDIESQSVAEEESTSEVSEISEAPELSELSELPELPEISKIPEVPEIPEASEEPTPAEPIVAEIEEAPIHFVDQTEAQAETTIPAETTVPAKQPEPIEPAVQPVPVTVEKNDGNHELKKQMRRRFLYGLLGGIAGTLIVLLLGVLAYIFMTHREIFESNRNEGGTNKPVVTAQAEPIEAATLETVAVDTAAIEEVKPAEKAQAAEVSTPETKPSDQPVYDTITKTRYLTTMAKEHYGSYHLWPYIYEENKAKLGHPDRIKPGTKVVIPPLSKYGVNPNSSADIAAAKRKGAAIYARYK